MVTQYKVVSYEILYMQAALNRLYLLLYLYICTHTYVYVYMTTIIIEKEAINLKGSKGVGRREGKSEVM